MSGQLGDVALVQLLEFSKDVARRAGAIILEGSHAIKRSQSVNQKKNAVDLVTEWDVRVEQFVKSEIATAYPTFQFIGEESYAAGERPTLTDEPTFCVDPIDGTTNFVHGFPFACISIGLIYKKAPTIGVIFNPFLNQLYSALSGHGTWLNDTTRLPLHPPGPLESLSQALIAIEYGSDRSKEIMDLKARSFTRLAGDPDSGIQGGKMGHSLRSLGSAALNFAQVASGSLDVYWEIGCWSWDVCAGVVLAQEAGGFVSGSHNSPHDGIVTEELLLGRKYIVVRPIADTETEKGVDAQKRIVKEFYATVEDYDPK
ncbi:myo inositol monophosphatase [Clavulina sp. PMI_390]|nr:myo inositol monophosphatase [Clavulina sp. PMI_390]